MPSSGPVLLKGFSQGYRASSRAGASVFSAGEVSADVFVGEVFGSPGAYLHEVPPTATVERGFYRQNTVTDRTEGSRRC